MRALSYTDPAKALQVWKDCQDNGVLDDPQDDYDPVSGTALEAQELPRQLLSSSRRIDPSAGSDESNTTGKKCEAVPRRRARQREQYVAQRQAAGKLKQPAGQLDPERWIPKYERAGRQRRRPRDQQYHKGAQGGVSEQEADKLDVVARQAARASEEVDTSRSTAHMTVSGGGGGRKRR